MATTLRLRDFLGRELLNETPGTTDPAKDGMGRNVLASNLDYMGRALVATARANSTAYAAGAHVQFASGNLYRVVVAGTSAGSAPSESGVDYGEILEDGTADLERVF